MVEPAHRARFLADPEGAFADAGLTEQERDLVRRRDWRGLIHYGVIFFMLEKLGAVVGVSNLHIYAAMRGQSLEEFQKTRNAQVMYSVTGREGRDLAWDRDHGESEVVDRARPSLKDSMQTDGCPKMLRRPKEHGRVRFASASDHRQGSGGAQTSIAHRWWDDRPFRR